MCFKWNTRSAEQSVRLCQSCWHSLQHLTLNRIQQWQSDIVIYSLFKYEKIIRELILRAKVKNDYRAVSHLIALTVENKTVMNMVERCSAMMPAPSSLWGRIRGRFDIAYLIAHALSAKGNRPVVFPPKRLYWRMQKQALHRKAEVAGNLTPATPSIELNTKPLLIIDDVLTTGFTLRNLIHHLNYEPSAIQVFTFAAKKY